MQFNNVLRYTLLFLFAVQQLYWLIGYFKAEKLKPRTKKDTLVNIIERTLIKAVYFVIFIQLLGVNILQFSNNNFLVLSGFILSIIGIIISISARKEIAANWTCSDNYQIKKNHSLVTSGIYRYIRHPIYLGMGISFLGVELLVQSYLIFFAPLGTLMIFYWAKREEALLTKHFKESYLKYKRKTKMFLPFII